MTGYAKEASHTVADACCVFYRIAVANSLCSKTNKPFVVECFNDKIVFVCFFILRLVLMVECFGSQMRAGCLPAVLRRDWNSEQCYAAVTVIGPKLV